MKRNHYKLGSHNGNHLAHTAKNLKTKSNTVNEEYARELAQLDKLKKARENKFK